MLGDYRLVCSLGRGSMGRVLLGRAVDGRLVAIKQIHAHLADQPDFRARFRLEVAASRRVTGAYTAAVVDADPDADVPWLASEYVPGPSLETVIEQCGALPPDSLWRLSAGLATALDGIHRVGLVHRDVKPSNVLLAADGPRVIDFGVARAMDADDGLTGTGSVIGSPAFMSPEQAQGKPLTAASDMFAFGSVLVAAATGRGPFGGTSVPQTLFNVVHVQPEVADVPDGLRELVLACLNKNPARRPSAREALSVLAETPIEGVRWPDDVLDMIDAQRAEVRKWLQDDDTLVADSRPSRRRRLVAAAAVLAVCVPGVAAWLWLRDESAPTAQPSARFDVTAADLRGVDTCALFDELKEFGAPEQKPVGYDWGACTATLQHLNGDEVEVTIKLGQESIRSFDRTPTTIAGVRVTEGSALRDPGCVLRVRSPRDQDATVEIETDSHDLKDICAATTTMLTRIVERLSVNAPRTELDPESIQSIAPCSTVDPAVAVDVGGAPTVLVPVRMHACEWWSGNENVEVSFGERPRPDRGDPPAKTPAGHDVYELTDPEFCAATYMFRPTVNDQAEVVWVSVSGEKPGLPPFCERVRTVVDAVAERLPTP